MRADRYLRFDVRVAEESRDWAKSEILSGAVRFRRAARLWGLAWFAALAPGLAAASGGGDDHAKAILAAYGRPNGLCAVVCASNETPGSLLAGLAKDSIVVHAVTDSAATRARLVKETAASPGSGRIMVQQVDLASLPYLDNLVNLLVVNDLESLRRLGCDSKEMGRVVAPGGTIAVMKSGTWEITKKAWPAGMDEWTHPNYDAGGGRASSDAFVKTPLDYKWCDGAPVPAFYYSSPKFKLVKFGICRTWVISNGRHFVLSLGEPENFSLAWNDEIPQFLVARDAFNGLLLWKIPLEPVGKNWGRWDAPAPLVAGKDLVYASQKEKITAFDAATGAVKFRCESDFRPMSLILSGQTLVITGRKHGGEARNGEVRVFDPCLGEEARYDLPAIAGRFAVEAFDAATGGKLWSVPDLAPEIQAAGGAVCTQVFSGKVGEPDIVGRDLRTGHERFRLTARALGKAARLLCTGPGYQLLNRGKDIVAISTTDGSIQWTVKDSKSFWGPVIQGEFWNDRTVYDLTTGKELRTIPRFFSGAVSDCCPGAMVNTMCLDGKFSQFHEVRADGLQTAIFRGARAMCQEGYTPAEGMLFTAPMNCTCVPAHPYGFLALQRFGTLPTPEEFTTARAVEKGEAYDSPAPAAPDADQWTTYRGNAERSASSAYVAPLATRKRWETSVATFGGNGLQEDSLRSRCLPRMGAPVCGDGKIFVCLADRGEVVALDARTGAVAWRYRAGSRIDTSAGIYRGRCFFGSNEGYVYALAAKDGRLIWRARLAPRDTLMMEHGMIESMWPVLGAALVYKDTLYAAAGRNSESAGGVVIAGLDPATGRRKWTRYIDVVQRAKNDVLSIVDGMLAWQNLQLDPATGEGDLRRGRIAGAARTGMWDTTKLYIASNRRVGTSFEVDGTADWLLAWNERCVVSTQEVRQRRPPSPPRKPVEKAAKAAKNAPQPLRTAESGPEEPVKYFSAPREQATALVAAANAALYGFGGPTVKQGRVYICSYDNPEGYDILLPSGVAHNGIALMKDGIVVAMENGSVAVYERAPVMPAANAGFVLRVDCGSDADYIDPQGNVWQADRQYKPGQWGAVGGTCVDRIKGRFKARVDDPKATMYLTERQGMSAYRFPVPNGRYAVTTHFAECFFVGDEGEYPNADLSHVRRCWNMTLNGETVLKDFEPLTAAGGKGRTPVVRRFETDVANGEITLRFTNVESRAFINGIEIVALPPAAPAADHEYMVPAPSAGENRTPCTLRVNCGGGRYTDSRGAVWSADRPYTDGAWGAIGGRMADRTRKHVKEVTGTKDAPIYLTERDGMSAYRFTVPPGPYAVVLHFAETYWGPGGECEMWGPSNGPRRFNVTINGLRVLNGFDPLADAGGKNYFPVVKRFATQAPDGIVEIRFTGMDHSPFINGIEILGKVDNLQPATAISSNKSPVSLKTMKK